MAKKFTIPLGEFEIVAEVSYVDPEVPYELVVYIRNKEGQITQDICLVRPHCEYKEKIGNFVTDNDFVDCLVWADSDDEDYTHEHVIGVYKEEE